MKKSSPLFSLQMDGRHKQIAAPMLGRSVLEKHPVVVAPRGMVEEFLPEITKPIFYQIKSQENGPYCVVTADLAGIPAEGTLIYVTLRRPTYIGSVDDALIAHPNTLIRKKDIADHLCVEEDVLDDLWEEDNFTTSKRPEGTFYRITRQRWKTLKEQVEGLHGLDMKLADIRSGRTLERVPHVAEVLYQQGAYERQWRNYICTVLQLDPKAEVDKDIVNLIEWYMESPKSTKKTRFITGREFLEMVQHPRPPKAQGKNSKTRDYDKPAYRSQNTEKGQWHDDPKRF